MRAQKETSTQAAEKLFNRFTEWPHDFSVVRMQHTLLKTLNDAALNESCTFDDADYLNFYYLGRFLFDIEVYLMGIPNAKRVGDELRKHGITIDQINATFGAIYNRIERGKFDEQHKETLRKLWCIISDKPELVNL